MFDSCWEHSDFSFNPSMPVSLAEKYHLSSFIITIVIGRKLKLNFLRSKRGKITYKYSC